jgi:molecular chaperone DnaK
MTTDRPIGIDLGTTYSCAAIMEQGKPRIIKSRLGYATIPSVVTFDDRGEPVVGQPAERRMITEPANTIYGSKRLLGRTFLKGLRSRFQPHFRYELVSDDDGFVAARVCDRTVSLVEASAMILAEIRKSAQISLGQTIRRAVITVPAYFNENQRAAVRLAGLIAELDVIRIINEPTAAALAFGVNRREKKRLLVFDLGGGTFDVSLVDLDGNIFNVIGVDGDTFLGGIDFDRCLVELLLCRIEEQQRRDLIVNPVGLERLRVAAQEAKHQLSVQQQAMVQLPRLPVGGGRVVDVSEVITRAEFEDVAGVLIERVMEVVERAVSTAGLTARDFDEVLLVGGQTRMPVLHDRLKALFHLEPTKRVHADEVVALGAAIAADAPRQAERPVLNDVVPLPIGLAHTDGSFVPLFARNARVPCEAHTAVKIPPRCERVRLAIFQGDHLKATDNEYLGAVVLDDLPPQEREVDGDLRLKLNKESLLKVYITIPRLQIDREVTLATQQTPDEVLNQMGRERIRFAAFGLEDAGLRPAPEPPKKAQGLLGRLLGLFRRS